MTGLITTNSRALRRNAQTACELVTRETALHRVTSGRRGALQGKLAGTVSPTHCLRSGAEAILANKIIIASRYEQAFTLLQINQSPFDKSEAKDSCSSTGRNAPFQRDLGLT